MILYIGFMLFLRWFLSLKMMYFLSKVNKNFKKVIILMNIEEFLFCSFSEICTFILLVFSHVSFQYLLNFLIISSFLSLIEKDSFMGIFSCFFYIFPISPLSRLWYVFDNIHLHPDIYRISGCRWGTSMLGKRYTAKYKIEKVKEYLSKIENGKRFRKLILHI